MVRKPKGRRGERKLNAPPKAEVQAAWNGRPWRWIPSPRSPLATAVTRLPSQHLAGLDSHVPPPAQVMEGMETGGVVDVPDTPNRTIHSETNKSLVGRSICSDMILEVPDTPDRLASQQAGGSGTYVQSAGVSNRLRGSHNISSIVGKSQRLETNFVDFDLPSRGENIFAVDGIKKSDATQLGTSKFSKMNARKHEAFVASSRDKFIEASSSHGSPSVSLISANCEIKKGNWKKAIASSGEVSHVGTKGRNNKITHQRFAAESATSSRDNDPLVDSFDFQARYKARNKHNGAPSFETNKLTPDRICPKVGIVIGANSRSKDRGACGTRDGSSKSKHNVDHPRISLARDHGKEVHFDGNSQVGSVQNGSVPLEPRKYGQRKLVRNGRISPNNIVNEFCSFELIGKINRDGDVGTTCVNDDQAKDKGKGADGRTTAVNAGVVKDRHSSRRSPVPKLDELFRTAELMRGSESSNSCLEHKPASSSINIHCASRRGISKGNHGVVEEEASRVDPRSQNTSHGARKHHSQNVHLHNDSSSAMADEDFQMDGQNRLLRRLKRQCTSFSKNYGESSAFSSVHSFSVGMLSAPGCSGSSSNLGPIIEIDETSFSNAERCDRSHDSNNRNDVSEERARQIEADEELARQLQEELYNENFEADTSIALILQHEENSRAISTRSHDVSSPMGVSRVPFYRHRSSTQNTSRLANRVHSATSTRIAQMRRNLVVYPRRASYRRRSIEFPDGMGLDMRLDILEAMEASTLPITNPLFRAQRDFDENDYEMLLSLDDENHRSSGASVLRISSLPQSVVQSETCEEACAVCLENPSRGDTIRHLPCLHKFHKDCIDPWLARNPSCPVCKSGIT